MRVNDIVEAAEKEREGGRKIPKTRIVSRKNKSAAVDIGVRGQEGGVMGRKEWSREGLYIALECQIWGTNRVVESQERVLVESNESA